MKTYILSFTLCCLTTVLCAQILFQEDFEGGTVPINWENRTNALDGGWKVGTPANLSSQYFSFPENGSTNIAATNDDKCNCNKRDEYFVTPAIDLSTVNSAVLRFDSYYTDQSIQGNSENASIEISTDGVSWTQLDDLHGHGEWDRHSIDLASYLGEDTVYIGFYYDDAGVWAYGFGIDNVIVEVPLLLDAQIVSSESAIFGEVNKAYPISCTIYNNGLNTINSLEFGYSINGNTSIVESLNNLNLAAFEYMSIETTVGWIPSAIGSYTLEFNIDNINGQIDEDTTNNKVSFDIEVYGEVIVPNKIDMFLADEVIISEVTEASNGLNKPTDLDFFPVLGKNELWVINQRTEAIGGSTLKISDATESSRTVLSQVDGNSWHFMSLPTGIAFSPDNFNFASSPGVQDANHNGGTFTGPSLWSSDPEIYAQPSGGNGSHLDMLHGSPRSMGIAHEVDNVFWVYDNWNKDIVRYDFVDDHGPGNDDHADAIVRRFKNIGINADGDIPNHMILDKSSGWLYSVDNGNNRVFRLDINSGSNSLPLALINEALAEHSQILGFTTEDIITSNLTTPCGIELFENYLLVGEYFSGDIVVYDLEDNFLEVGRISTLESGLTGIKIGPEGNIWITNRLQNRLSIIEPSENSAVINKENSQLAQLFPNPSNGIIHVRKVSRADNQTIQYKVYSAQGKELASGQNIDNKLDLTGLSAGLYTIELISKNITQTEIIVIQ